MGTNYYLKYNICPTCKRGQTLHIGKCSMGWTFCFRGYRISDFASRGDCNDLLDTDIFGTGAIETYKEWLNVFEYMKNAKIFDEYGDEVSVEEFMKMVEDHADSPNNHAATYSRDTRCWIDSEGHSFSGYDFS